VTAICLPPEGDAQNDRALFTPLEPTTLTGSDPSGRGGSVPAAGKQPDPIGVTHSAPDSFYELVAR
jgi:hypothetical protein